MGGFKKVFEYLSRKRSGSEQDNNNNNSSNTNNFTYSTNNNKIKRVKKNKNDIRILRNWFRLRCRRYAIPPEYYVNYNTGRVQKLDLHDVTYISPALVRQLDQLEELSLAQFSVPSEQKVISRIFEWKNLKVLNTRFPMEPEILRKISTSFTQLHTLSLAFLDQGGPRHGRFYDLSLLRDLPNLRVLTIIYGATAAGGQEEVSLLSEVTNLEELILVRAIVPPGIGKLKNLRKLVVDDLPPCSRFGEPSLPRQLAECKELCELSLVRCKDLRVLPFGMHQFPKLSTVEVSEVNTWQGFDFVYFSQGHSWSTSESLTTLKLRHLRLGSRPDALKALLSFVTKCCPNLERLNLSRNEIASLDEFSEFRHSRLQKLDLSGNLIVLYANDTERQRFTKMMERLPRLSVRLGPSGMLSLGLVDLITPASLLLMDLNANGRHLIVRNGVPSFDVPLSLWPAVLERISYTIHGFGDRARVSARRADAIYYLLRNGPALAARVN